MRLPAADAWEQSMLIAHEAQVHGVLWPVLWHTLRGMPWAWTQRRVVPPRVQQMHRLVFGPATVAPLTGAPRTAAETIAGRR
jgi:hypothetical protein